MTKDINGPLGLDALVEELETAQLAQLIFERSGTSPHRPQQAQREFPTNHGSGLEKSFCFLRQSVDARHHDIVDRVRHEVRAKVVCVERQLLEKERIAIGLGD